MLNLEIIASEALKKNFNFTGDNLHTFAEWKSKGYHIIKGQKAFIKCRTWSEGINKRLTPSVLFTDRQVLRIL